MKARSFAQHLKKISLVKRTTERTAKQNHKIFPTQENIAPLLWAVWLAVLLLISKQQVFVPKEIKVADS